MCGSKLLSAIAKAYYPGAVITKSLKVFMRNRTDIRNTTCICVGESLWGFQSSMVASATVLTVLLTRFGASERLIGSIAAIAAGTIAVPQLLGIYLFHSTRRRKRQLIAWHLYAIIPFHFVTGLLTLFSNGFPAWLTHCLLLVSYGCMLTGHRGSPGGLA